MKCIAIGGAGKLHPLQRAVGLFFLGMIGAALLTATIIFLCPESSGIYVAAGFTLL
jgi:hypothetical protein